jgi:hypothetical protein
MGTDTISAIVISGTDTVDIFQKAIVYYLNPVSIDERPISPNEFYLFQNSPNPFNPSTMISYQLPRNGNASLTVYDVLGNQVATLVDEFKPAGKYKVEFDAAKLPSGIYFYKLQVENFLDTKKMILIK